MFSYEETWQLENLEVIKDDDPDLQKIEEVMVQVKELEDGES